MSVYLLKGLEQTVSGLVFQEVVLLFMIGPCIIHGFLCALRRVK